MRVLILLAALLPASLHAAPYIPTMNGDRFVAAIIHTGELTDNDYVEREKAYGYIDGVRDAAEGRDWCNVTSLKTHDLAQSLASEIQKRSPSERQRNASRLLIELLQKKYPCRQGATS